MVDAPAGERGAELPVDFDLLYRRHRDAVYRLALRYGAGQAAWAEDVVQDVFVVALGDPAFCRGHAEPAVWLYRVTTQRCLTRLKRERVFGAIQGLLGALRPDEQRTPERVYGGAQALGWVDRWFDALPAREKIAFAMSVYDGKSQADIAQMLGLSKGYVSKLLARVEAELNALQQKRDAHV